MDLRVGISANDLVSRVHNFVSLESAGGLKITMAAKPETAVKQITIAAGKMVNIRASGSCLQVDDQFGGGQCVSSLDVTAIAPGADIVIKSLKRNGVAPAYKGQLQLLPVDGKVRVVLITDLDTYVKGVLRSEMPDSYHLEALKAQAVAARTYGLHPRLSHEAEGFNVCDSFLHCQAFYGTTFGITPKDEQCIDATAGEILTFAGRPIIAVFSANAGGHTESYENCFSDPITNQFPPPPVPYLKGVPEGSLPKSFPSQKGLRLLWQEKNPPTADAWSSEFRWKTTLTQRDYEGHMHYVIEDMLADPQFQPFISTPASGKFGHINGFEVTRRGVSGVAMSMTVRTSTGDWIIEKELTIRSIFRNPELKIPRLHSARFVMEQQYDRLGLLSGLTILGLGFGHGVGLQQTGAEGWARQGKTYRQILLHYYPGAQISKA